MKITVNHIAVEGTPKEVFELIHLMDQQPPKPASPPVPFKPYTGTPYIGTGSITSNTTLTANKGTSYCLPTRYQGGPPVSIFWTT